jgi:hypothetical protein
MKHDKNIETTQDNDKVYDKCNVALKYLFHE